MTETPKLEPEDFAVLLEALDSWVHKDLGGELIHSLLGPMLAPKPENVEETARYKKFLATEQANLDQAKRLRGERATLLKAKLLTLRDKQACDDLLAQKKVRP